MGWLYALFAVGTGIKALAQLKSGSDARKLGEYNAAQAELRAQDAEARGALDEARFRQNVKVTIGAQRAGFASQGVDVGSGSAVDVQADSAYLGEMDARTIRMNAAREAFGYRVDAENYRRGGQLQQTESRFGAADTVIGNTTSALAARYGWGGKK